MAGVGESAELIKVVRNTVVIAAVIAVALVLFYQARPSRTATAPPCLSALSSADALLDSTVKDVTRLDSTLAAYRAAAAECRKDPVAK